MPNIVIVGWFPTKIFRNNISNIIIKLGIDPADGVITYAESGISCRNMTKKQEISPYLIVRDTNEKRARKIAKALNVNLNTDVEVEILMAFLPKKLLTKSPR